MNAQDLTAAQRQIRSNVRNFLMVATREQLARELAISIERGDQFRAECVRELIDELGPDPDATNPDGWDAIDPHEDDDDSDPIGLEEFLASYVDTALWSSHDFSEDDPDGSEMLDANHGPDDISPETLAEMRDDCRSFLRDNAHLIGTEYDRAGHDFWLTRNRHGAGFWDGDWDHGDELTSEAHAYGSVDLYVGDDGKVYA